MYKCQHFQRFCVGCQQHGNQIHNDPEPGGEDAARQVVHALRGRGEAEADRGGARHRHRQGRQAHQLCRV